MAANHWALAVESHAANFLRASGNHLGLVVPYRGKGISTTTDQPLPTQDTRDRFALVLKNYGDGSDPSMAHSPRDPLGAVTTQDHHSVVEMDRVPVSVEDCGFRMLEPHEIKAAMAFPVAYIIKGNKRDQVRQAGNAVTPPAMTMLVAAAVETLA
jgi:DNA (cytosine-5)-methyltransferase 1